MPQTPKLDFVYFDAGGGHRSAAMALQSVIESEDYGWDVRLVNLQEILAPLDIFRKVTHVGLQELYNILLARGWTLGSSYLLPMMHGVIRVYHPAQVRLLASYWRQSQPDMVVSLVPNFNRALFQSLKRAAPGVPFVTILTDFADYPPHFWIEKQPEQYLVCGTPLALQQALKMGHPADRAFLVSGMILRPEFYQTPSMDRATERSKLGLNPQLPTALVLFGGEGSNVMVSIAERLGNSSLDLQLIMICGRNAKLRERLLAMKTRNRMHIEGFTKKVPYYMQLSDFLIGKPGPGSISEAFKMKLPVIVERNAWTLPQERYNAKWVREQQAGVVLRNFREVEGAVGTLLANGQLASMKSRLEAMENGAVYEVPRLLGKVLMERRQ